MTLIQQQSEKKKREFEETYLQTKYSQIIKPLQFAALCVQQR